MNWPARLWIVRHGESAGNVARDLADSTGAVRIDVQARDADVPLSARGEEQAAALGRWFASQNARPQVVLASPYLRARQTVQLAAQMGAFTADAAITVDERLREREFGVLDRLTRAGIEQLHPEQAQLRTALGKFYHRPPGGESWCDVILRLRSAVDTLSLHHTGAEVLIVAHQVVVLCLRYLLEDMDEEQILDIDSQGEVANCGVTEYVAAPRAKAARMQLVRYNFTAPLQDEGAPVTSAPDAKVAAR